jgi:3-mercaptopyruvate sulfurtransferase SseA
VKIAKAGIPLIAAACLLLAGPAAAQDLDGHLVDVQWLEKNRSNPNLLVLDASPTAMYTAQHIPGAVSVDFMVYGGQERPLAEWERLYQSWGVGPGKRIVLYDQGATFMATRVLYSLLYHGVPAKDLSILDGGMARWKDAGLPVTKDATPPRPGTFKVKAANEELRVRLPEFLEASGDPVNHVLLEALGPDWHFGEIAPFGRPGHPPHGVMLPSADLFNADKTFKSPEDLRRILSYLNVRPDQDIYTYCGGGVAASAPFFALKFILGYPKVKLFVESEMGWAADVRQLPQWTYDAPFLMRDTGWLQAWGGRMMRLFANSQVTVVDLRPADAYAQGHVPFALNVPAEVFREHVRAPQGLAEVLGPAGVNRAHEAVVISGAGLTRDAALAFVMLEKLGQRKVSIFMDSMGRWTELGQKLTTAPTPVGPRKAPGELAIEPAAYPPGLRQDVLVSAPLSARGLYPTVFVASGATVPAGEPGGTVVHVPSATLLNQDGTPKAAHEIWQALTKAGVPRYAELVCFSDDPGDAAANYYILRLMGYPDVKVLVK